MKSPGRNSIFTKFSFAHNFIFTFVAGENQSFLFYLLYLNVYLFEWMFSFRKVSEADAEHAKELGKEIWDVSQSTKLYYNFLQSITRSKLNWAFPFCDK
jgi:hypothetical protein